MKNFKRTLALMLVLCMVCGFLPMRASAATLGLGTTGTVAGEPFDDSASLSGNAPAHTNYRIPGMVMLDNGTLVAAADIRYDYEYDGGGSDIVVSRSGNGGESWNYTVVAYLGDNGNVHAKNSSTMMDPLLITDGTILYLLYDLFPAGLSLGGGDNTTSKFSATGTGFNNNGKMVLSTSFQSTTGGYYLDGDKIYADNGTVQSGYTVDEWFNVYQSDGTYVSNLFFASGSPFYAYPTSYIAMQTSTDGGGSWTTPELVNIKHANTTWQVLGPGSGLVTKNGELAFTVYNSDNSISLVHGTSGAWKTVKTSSATNESSIVELADGTIRAFVKNGNNVITYVDFTPSGDTYTAGGAKDTGVPNTGWCMISSIVYPETIDGQSVIMVCCPSTGTSDRANGKIHVFKVDSSNNMTYVKSHEINGSGEFFAYSDMAVLPDGTIALLYEDGCLTYNGSPAGVGYSHIEYTTVDPVDDMGLTFGNTTGGSEEQEEDVNPGEEYITLHVGETHKIELTTDIGSGSHSSTAADVAWSTTSSVSYPLAQLGTTSAYSGEKIDLNDCLYTFSQNSNGTWVISGNAGGTTVYVDAYNVDAKYPNRTTAANVTITESGYTGTTDGAFIFGGTASNGKSGSLHFHTQSGTYYWNQCGGAHAENNSNGTHGIFVLKLNGTEITEVTDLDDLKSNEQYLIAGKGGDGNYYVMHPTTAGTSDLYAHLAKVTGETAEGEGITSEITITGKAIGTTEVTIGDVKYNITVTLDGEEVILKVGETSETFTIEGQYNTAEGLDTSIATVKMEDVTDTKTKYAYTEVEEQPTCADLIDRDYEDPQRTDYFYKVGENYYPLYATRTSSGRFVKTYYYTWYYSKTDSSGDVTQIGNSSQETQYPSYTDASCEPLYEQGTATETVHYTNITFTGVNPGVTYPKVGDTQYIVTVLEDRYITIPAGHSLTDVIEGVSYSKNDVTVGPDTDVAKLVSVTATTPKLIPVTSIESGKQYLIVNKATGAVLTNTSVTADGEWVNEYKSGLDTTGTASTDSTELWTITSAADGKFTVTRDGKYLTMSGFYAAMSDTATGLTLSYTSSGWTLMDNTTCYSFSDHDKKDYYLSDNVGHGYDEAALGTGDLSTYCYWDIYEIDDGGDTEVTFAGVAPGETTATIGGYTYHITVVEAEVDVKLHVGQSKTLIIDGYQYTMDNVTTAPNASIAKLDSVVPANAKLVPVSEIVSGEKYLIVNSQTGEVLTDTAITLTGDAGEKSALVTEGTASVDNPELWTITGDPVNGYTVVQNGKYLTVAGYYAAMSSTATALKLSYSGSGWMICDDTTWQTLNHDNADYYLRNGITDANYDTDALGSSITSSYSYWKIYRIDSAPVTEVTFTGVKAGTTTAKVGHVTYNITVDTVTEGDISDFNNIVGVEKYSDDNTNATYRSDLDMAGKKITSLRISEGASFHLGVDVTEYESVTWTTADPDIATVDADGNVTAVKAGVTNVTATVVKNGIEESITIPVTVVPSMVEGYADSAKTTVFYYIENIDYTDPYYTMFLDTESTTEPVEGHRLVKVSEGEVIWYERPTESAFAWIWTADPWEGYALTKMGSTGSIDEYYPLRDTNDITKLGDSYVDVDGNGSFTAGTDSEYYYTSGSFSSNGAPNNAYKNVVLVGNDAGASWRDALDDLLEESILIGLNVWPNYGCDGAMSNTRWDDGDHGKVPKLVTSMTFISDPMPHIEKSVRGILPTTRLRKDFRTYTDGMVATVGEYVYFQVSITLDRPTTWKDEANGFGAITYTDAIVTDNVLPGAYFYIQTEDDNMDGVLDENDNYTPTTEEDITEALNKAWGAEEKTRTIDLYVIYEIIPDDIPKFQIENTANLTWNYKSHYSTGSLSGSADAEATITVVGYSMDDVVIDFGQSITYTGLKVEHLKYASVGENVDYTAKYGTVTLTGVGDPITDSSGTYYNEYVLTYTPTSILQQPDAIQIYGTYKDEENSKSTVRKVINGFVVYPATTVYYEEGFVLENNTSWPETGAAKATVDQTFEMLGKSQFDGNGTLSGYVSDKKHAYGYDPIYDGDALNNAEVADSSITATALGAKTEFNFTGTGLELYANCQPDSGRVIVEIRQQTGTADGKPVYKNVKMYLVNTAATAGGTDATVGQETDLDTLPIVSVKDLPHGSYNVQLTKLGEGSPVTIDGVRIVNTVADSAVFEIDKEEKPAFNQLRDMVLNSFGVALEDISVDYKDMCDQVYNAANGAAAIITSESVDYANSSTLQDLLDNGPKNELYLWAGQTLTFKVTTSRALQIGLKAPEGSANYSLSYNNGTTTQVADDVTLSVSEDLFYELGNTTGTNQEYTITVTNTGSKILSVTDLKICDDPDAAFVSLEQNDIRNILLAAGYVDPDATDAPEEPVIACADAVLNIVLVDYTGKRLSSAQLIANGPVNEAAVFTADQINAAAKLPKGYDFADEVTDAQVTYGKSATVTIRAGKAATVRVTYVNMFGKTVGTATFTKVQTAPGFFSVTAEQIRNAAPEGRTVLWLSGAMAAYGRETNLIVPVL